MKLFLFFSSLMLCSVLAYSQNPDPGDFVIGVQYYEYGSSDAIGFKVPDPDPTAPYGFMVFDDNVLIGGQPTSIFSQLKEDGFDVLDCYTGSGDWSINRSRSLMRLAYNNSMMLNLSAQKWCAIQNHTIPPYTDPNDQNNPIYPISEVPIFNGYSTVIDWNTPGLQNWAIPTWSTYHSHDIDNYKNYLLDYPTYNEAIWGIRMVEEPNGTQYGSGSAAGKFPADYHVGLGRVPVDLHKSLQFNIEIPPEILSAALVGYHNLLGANSNGVNTVTNIHHHGSTINAHANDASWDGTNAYQNQLYDPVSQTNLEVLNGVKADNDPQEYLSAFQNKNHDIIMEGTINELGTKLKTVVTGKVVTVNHVPVPIKVLAPNWGNIPSYDEMLGNSSQNNKAHYLGMFHSIDYLKQNGNSVFKMIGTPGAGFYLRQGASDPEATAKYFGFNTHLGFVGNTPAYHNGNFLWFQAYNSIVHGVDGIFYNNFVWKDHERKGFVDGIGAPYYDGSRYNLSLPGNEGDDGWPELYKDFQRHLTREMAYLEKRGFLSKKAVLANRTAESDKEEYDITQYYDEDLDPLCIVPPIDDYLPVNALGFIEDELSGQLIPKSKYDDERYGVRYTIRTNEEGETIIILANQLPFPTDAITFNFDNAKIPGINNSKGVKALFNGSVASNVLAFDYKKDRDGVDDLQNLVLKKSSATTLFGPQQKEVTFKMGALDVIVLEFVPDDQVSSTAGWEKVWSNNGSGKLRTWNFAPSDLTYFGNFDGSTDGSEEMLLVQGGSNSYYMSLFSYNEANEDWTQTWSNWGHTTHMMIPYKDNFHVADVNNDGQDELWGTSSSGWITQFKFNNSTQQFDWGWSTGNCSNSNSPILDYDDEILMADFDGDGDADVFGIDHVNDELALLTWNPNLGNCGDWFVEWTTTNPAHASHSFKTFIDADKSAADLNSSAATEILCVTSTYAVIFSFDNTSSTFNWIWDISDGAFAGWNFPFQSDDRYCFGDFDYDQNASTNDQREEMFIAGTSVISEWAATMDLNYSAPAGYSWSWNWPLSGTPAHYIDDWKIAGTYGNTKYAAAKLGTDGRDYLVATRGYFPSPNCPSADYNTALSIYKVDLGVQSNYKKDGSLSDLRVNSEKVEIYPNPSKGSFFIESSSGFQETSKIELFSTVGKVLKTIETFPSNTIEVDLGDYKGAVIVRQTNMDGQIENSKMILH